MRVIRHPLWLIASCILLLSSCSDEPAVSEPLQVTDAWIRKPVPPLDKTAGYFLITNHSPDKVVLTGARSDAARSIEFHETVQVDDMMRMRRLKQLELGPGESVQFAPGGKHLMIFGFKSVSSPVGIELQFSSGQTLDVPFELR